MSVKAEAEAFRQIPLFKACEPAHLQMISFSAERVEFMPGDLLIRQGEKGAAAYLILRGKAEAFIDEEDDRKPVALLEGGAFVGELAMIADLPYSISVRVLEKTYAMRIPRTLFMRVASEFPEFGTKVQAALSSKLDLSLLELKKLQTLFVDSSSPSR